MLIDSSLAHGLAQRSHRELLGQAKRVVRHMAQERKARPTMPVTRKGARRYLREFLQPVKARALYVLETETRREGPACRYLDFRAGQEDRTVSLILGTFAPLSPIIEEGEVAPGDRIEQVEQAEHDWTVARTFKLLIGGGHKQVDALAQLNALSQLETLAESWRLRAAKLAAQL